MQGLNEAAVQRRQAAPVPRGDRSEEHIVDLAVTHDPGAADDWVVD